MKNRKMGKGILVVGLVLYGAMDVVAQSVTYSHDAAKMNQITVGEIGSGSLTPGCSGSVGLGNGGTGEN